MELIEALKSFNRKERYWLIRNSFGKKSEKLDRKFLDSLEGQLSITVPENAWWAMDYHLDWLCAGLMETFEYDKSTTGYFKGGIPQVAEEEMSKKLIYGQQQDIDLIVAFKDSTITHLILIEAKGVTGWNNAQLESKARRLKNIFGDAGDYFKNVIPHFVTISPTSPSDSVDILKFPSWMKNDKKELRWILLNIPSNLKAVTRCDAGGTASKDGVCWK